MNSTADKKYAGLIQKHWSLWTVCLWVKGATKLHNTLYKYLSPSENFISTACLVPVPVPVTVPGKHAPIPIYTSVHQELCARGMQHVVGDQRQHSIFHVFARIWNHVHNS